MSLAFPMRLQESGLLRREDPVASVISLLQVMARTPAGSWPGSASFGLRDLFESNRQRADVARLALERINDVFADLGLTEYTVTDVVRELSPGRDTDTYSISIEQSGSREVFTTFVSHES